MRFFALNLLLALAWGALSGRFSPANLLLGFVVAYFLLLLSRPVTGESVYLRRLPRVLVFLAFFFWELLRASVRVAFDVLTPRHRMRPGIVAVPLDVRTDAEITLLANLITLTPGSLSVDVSTDRRVLYVHVMYIDDVDKTRAAIKQGFERWVLELLR